MKMKHNDQKVIDIYEELSKTLDYHYINGGLNKLEKKTLTKMLMIHLLFED